ncbi:hypothetical protein NDU88_001006 [Pleurodeles waltl]|uniref:Uncharacterized protein n=1 Tax=Pleurodeles waltl TaxID=8319 RepID=A0AAV7LWC9_PLEWA|nr:hypothetical protein NDU88_001006 [Pleurodeles waltl]
MRGGGSGQGVYPYDDQPTGAEDDLWEDYNVDTSEDQDIEHYAINPSLVEDIKEYHAVIQRATQYHNVIANCEKQLTGSSRTATDLPMFYGAYQQVYVLIAINYLKNKFIVFLLYQFH